VESSPGKSSQAGGSLKALELDETSSEAYEVLGWIALPTIGTGTEPNVLRRAIELNPAIRPYMWLSQYLNVAGQHQEALASSGKLNSWIPFAAHPVEPRRDLHACGAVEQSAEQCEKGLDSIRILGRCIRS